MTEHYDLIVIGSGPGGHEAAVKAGELGARVAIIEKGELGGTCTNVGCIPTKALLACSKKFAELPKLKRMGISVENPSFDFSAIKRHQASAVKIGRLGVQQILSEAQVDIVKGEGHIVAPGKVEVTAADGTKLVLEGKNILIAWGSVVSLLPGFELSERVITSDGFLGLSALPESMIIIGGGVIGVEFATFLSELGCQVTVVEFLPQILPYEDAETASFIQAEMEKHGVTFHTATKVQFITDTGTGVTAVALGPAGEVRLEAAYALMCVGRKPLLFEEELTALGVAFDKRGIQTDMRQESSVTGVYAIGDVTGGVLLAHRASKQGKALASRLFGDGAVTFSEQSVPSVVYTHPNVARVGLTEKQAAEQGLAVELRRFDYGANALARAELMGNGFVKLLFSDSILIGATIVGAQASELIALLGFVVANHLGKKELDSFILAHPTLSEVLWK